MDANTLQAIIDNSCQVPAGETISGLTPMLMTGLGSADSDLRENSLTVLDEWIEMGKYQPNELIKIGDQMAMNITTGLGESGTDSVFLRAFSALILGTVVTFDEKLFEKGQSFLPSDVFMSWFEASLEYYAGEKDFRGHLPEKGWAHSIAHGGDLLQELSRCRFLKREHLESIMNVVANKFTSPADLPLLYDEDERNSRVVITCMLRDLLDIEFMTGWVDQIVHADGGNWRAAYLEAKTNNARVNAKVFLRSLYFMLKFGMRNYHKMPFYDRTPMLR
ncbi:MAG: DUF2785 domain-containing protein, partial [Anaerolineaceae bacterium]|nr:DUF2785 domain-containing protein [Anaerolineaceae bacterium]